MLIVLTSACASGAASPPESVSSTDPTAAVADSTTTTAAVTTTIPVTTTTVAPTTTTTTISALVVARTAFLEMETLWDSDSLAVTLEHGDEGFLVPWEDQPAWCADQSVIDDAWAVGIAGYAWPAELQAEADELIAALAARSSVFLQCADLPGSFQGQSPIFDRTDAAYLALNAARDALRRGLGLPRIQYG
jgi:hypothetical protein